MLGRRSRQRPDEVIIEGFLLLDTGEYELVCARVPLAVFWQMKALEIVGHVRTVNQARAARPQGYPEVGSVWLVDGDLEAPATEPSITGGGLPAHGGDGPSMPSAGTAKSGISAPETQRVFRLTIDAVHALERVALEPAGPRLIETLDARDMVPDLHDD
jgi:hypothetical protein